jgi:uncharacterized protein (TIGR02147 family)
MKNPDIFSYTDYRKYLKDIFEYSKKQNRKFSYRYFCRQTGYRSSAILKEVMDGKRKLPWKRIRDFAKPFGLKEGETAYFEKLVLFNDAKDNLKKNIYFGELVKMRCKTRTKMITHKDAAFYSAWFNSAIRELVSLREFKEDPAWVSKKLVPNVTTIQARNALRLLLELGMVKRDESGKLVQGPSKLDVDPDMMVPAVKNFSRAMIELSWEAVERFKPEEREISGLTLALSKECYAKLREMVRKFQDDVMNHVCNEKANSEVVCRLNTELFPLVNGV